MLVLAVSALKNVAAANVDLPTSWVKQYLENSDEDFSLMGFADELNGALDDDVMEIEALGATQKRPPYGARCLSDEDRKLLPTLMDDLQECQDETEGRTDLWALNTFKKCVKKVGYSKYCQECMSSLALCSGLNCHSACKYQNEGEVDQSLGCLICTGHCQTKMADCAGLINAPTEMCKGLLPKALDKVTKVATLFGVDMPEIDSDMLCEMLGSLGDDSSSSSSDSDEDMDDGDDDYVSNVLHGEHLDSDSWFHDSMKNNVGLVERVAKHFELSDVLKAIKFLDAMEK